MRLHLGQFDLKISISKCACANRFSPCYFLLWWRVLWASLTTEYPSESAPPLSGEDGSEFLVPSFAGYALGGLPLGCEVGTLGMQPPPFSACPIHVVLGRVLSTSGSMESDSLETRVGMGQSEYSALDLWQCLSEVSMAHHQPFTSGRRMTKEQSRKSTQKMPLPHVFGGPQQHPA